VISPAKFGELTPKQAKMNIWISLMPSSLHGLRDKTIKIK
jgi:hypothetical protein